MVQRYSRWLAALLLVVSFLIPMSVQAATDPYAEVCKNGNAKDSALCNTPNEDPIAGPNGAIVNVTSILATIAGIVSVAFLVWGGLKYITSGGDSSGVSTAKQTILAALIGLVLALLARPIILFVISRV